jgi:methionyl-tRNA formyltransferase
LTPENLKHFNLAEHDLDLLIVAAYGLILPGHILDAPRLGCLNVHASLLPRWRGAAPVERAIMAGDTESGVCLMQMDEGLDTGPVYRCEALLIGPEETGSQLEARLAEAGGGLLLELLPELEQLTPRPQPEVGVTYADKLNPADSELDLDGSPEVAARRVRALTSRQPAALFIADPKAPGDPVRMRCLGAAGWTGSDMDGSPPGTVVGIDRRGLWLTCGEGTLCIPELQLNRGKGTIMTAKAAANGYNTLIHTGGRLYPRAADAIAAGGRAD